MICYMYCNIIVLFAIMAKGADIIYHLPLNYLMVYFGFGAASFVIGKVCAYFETKPDYGRLLPITVINMVSITTIHLIFMIGFWIGYQVNPNSITKSAMFLVAVTYLLYTEATVALYDVYQRVDSRQHLLGLISGTEGSQASDTISAPVGLTGPTDSIKLSVGNQRISESK